jgi:mycothiol synthase
MATRRVARTADAPAVARLRAIDDAVRRATGHEAVPEAVWRAARDRPAEVRLAVSDDGSVGAVTMPSDSFTPAFRQLAVAAVPGTPADAVVPVVERVVAEDGASSLTAWLPGTIAPIRRALEQTGFVENRRQHQMRVPLPRSDVVRIPDGVAIRAFRPGTDDAAWLRVNNRAFANHPDQGGWIAEVLTRRMAEGWFDPAGFLLAWRDDELAGFCWTKVHTVPERLGEIYVIGVDPDAQGTGLGRALVLAGLDHLARVRECPYGVLYVAADNTAAVALYESIGFEIVRTDTALVLDRTERTP